MNLNEFQKLAMTTRTPTYDDVAAVLGLTSEAGEVAGKYMKGRRDGNFIRYEVAKEVGDVLWNVAAIANDLGYDLDTIAQLVLDKLADRRTRGVIGGSGDNR